MSEGAQVGNYARPHVRTVRGHVIAAPVTCTIFSLPNIVDLQPMDAAELFTVETIAKRAHRKPMEARRAAGRYRLGRMYGK